MLSTPGGWLRRSAPVLGPYSLLVAVHVALAWTMRQPHLFADELGYLGHARYLAGTGGMPDMGTTTYYHFGYSLLLVPAFWLFPDPHETYRAVLVTNAFLISLLYVGLYDFLRRVLHASRGHAVVIASITCLYPASLLQSNLAWAENAVIPGYAALVCAFSWLVRRGTPASGVVFGLLSAFLYTVHPRMLPLVLLAAVLLLLLAWRRIVPWRTALVGLSCIAVVCVATTLSNEHLRSLGWAPHKRAERVTGMLSGVLSWTGVYGVALSAIGQLLYSTQATFGLFVVGVWYAGSQIRQVVVQGLRRLECPHHVMVLLFVLLSSTGILFAAAVSNAKGGPRADHFIYGRYMETSLPVLTVLGLAGLWRVNARVRWRAVVPATLLVLTLLTVVFNWTRGEALASRTAIVPANILGIYPVVREIGLIDATAVSVVAAAIFLIVGAAFTRIAAAGLSIVALCFAVAAAKDQEAVFVPIQPHLATANQLPEHVRQMGGVRALGYDQAFYHRGSVPLRFFSYQYLLPGVEFIRFNSAKGQRPPTDVVISGVGWRDAQRFGARLAAVEFDADQALWVLPGTIQGRYFPATYLGVPLGAQPVRGVQESGFYRTERDPAGPFRWTDGRARLIVPVTGAQPSSLTLELAGVQSSNFTLMVNGQRMFDGRLRRPRTFDISRVPGKGHITVELISGTFVPADVNTASSDRRALGVAIRRVMLE
jgi:hypothetical protein